MRRPDEFVAIKAFYLHYKSFIKQQSDLRIVTNALHESYRVDVKADYQSSQITAANILVYTFQ